MATFRQMVYMVLDLLKETSDDALYTEEHVAFLLSKMRAHLLEKKYSGSRNTPFAAMSDENRQTITLSMKPTNMLPFGCCGPWLKSTSKMPSTLGDMDADIYTVSDLLPTNVTLIPAERMPYVGHNRWLQNIIYAAKGGDDYLYMHSNNPQFIHLCRVQISGVFSDPEDALELDEEAKCSVMDADFPLEGALIAPCIEMVVQELSGARYAPQDKNNNAKDDLADAAVVPQRSGRKAKDDKEEE